MSDLSFFCIGTPAPGGSKSAFPMYHRDGSLVMKGKRPVIRVVDAGGEGNKKWKEAVMLQGRSFMRGAKPFECPVKCEFIFYLRRPLAHYVARDPKRPLRPDAPVWHQQAPDAKKYGRSTEDALTGVLWVDDSQVVRGCDEKRWCGPDDKEGCAIRIVLLPHNPQRP